MENDLKFSALLITKSYFLAIFRSLNVVQLERETRSTFEKAEEIRKVCKKFRVMILRRFCSYE